MKKKTGFLQELEKSKLPSIEYFKTDETLRETLYSQYLETELKPSRNLYINKYYTDEEIQKNLIKDTDQRIQKGRIEKCKQMPVSKINEMKVITADSFIPQMDFDIELRNITNEFRQLSIDNKLGEEFYCHRIEDTKIFKHLKSIQEKINRFKRRVLDTKLSYDPLQQGNFFSKLIINDLENLELFDLTVKVVEDFIADKENYYIENKIYQDDGAKFETKYKVKIEVIRDEYFEAKDVADSNLKEYLDYKRNFTDLERLNSPNNSGIKNSNQRPNRTDLAYFIYYLDETKYKILHSPFPSELAWKELESTYRKNWKNIQTMYLKIHREREERLRASRKGNIQYLIDNMLKEYPKALELAKTELNCIL